MSELDQPTNPSREPVADSQRLSIYVALTSPDLYALRHAIISQIEVWGYYVPDLAASSISSFHSSKGFTLADFRERVGSVMEQCILSVHLISNQTGQLIGDEEKSIVALQIEFAQEFLSDRIVWVHPGSLPHISIQKSLEEGMQQGVERLENRSLEYLKDVIEARLKRLRGETSPTLQTRSIVRVFLSHSSMDRDFVEREIISLLREHDIESWYYEANIEGAAEWERSISDGLKRCEWFLVVLSPRSVSSKWVRREVFWAMEKREGRIIPVVMETCDPDDLHIGLLSIQHVDFRLNTKAAQAKLLAIWGR